MRKGFTLAEVLITLSIIGVIAAMTMPVLIGKYKEKVLEVQNKKAQAVIVNGINRVMALEDSTDLASSSLMACNKNKSCIAGVIAKCIRTLNDNVSSDSYFDKEYKFDNGNFEVFKDSAIDYTFVSMDGVYYGLLTDVENNTISIFSDVNGKKTPNRGGKDLCKYVLTNNLLLVDHCADMTSWTPSATCDIDHLDLCSPSECNALSNAESSCAYNAVQSKCICMNRGGEN